MNLAVDLDKWVAAGSSFNPARALVDTARAVLPVGLRGLNSVAKPRATKPEPRGYCPRNL
jgi:hypothetical protein